MRQLKPKTRFLIILATVNIVVMIYPVDLYVQAHDNDAQFSAAIVLLGVAFLLAITDTVSALLAHLQ